MEHDKLAFAKESSLKDGLLIGAAIMIILAGLKAASAILLPFLLALFLAIIANPLVRFLSRFKIPRVASVLFVLVLIVQLMLLVASVVGSSLSDFNQSIPQYRVQLLERLKFLVDFAARFDFELTVSMVTGYFDPGVLLNVFANTLTGLSGVATNAFMILLISIFMLLEADTVPQRLYSALHRPDIRMSQINRVLTSVNRYIAMKAAISFITAVPIFIVLHIMGLDFAPLWALLAFLLNFVPNVGSLLAAIPPIILALLQFGASQSLGVMALYLSVNMIIGNVIEPRVMGKGMGLSSLVVILSLIFWGWLFGSVGMLLSVPLTMILKIALESSDSGHWIASLLGHPDDLKQQDLGTTERE